MDKVEPANSGVMQSIAQDLQVKDPEPDIAKGIINDARTVRHNNKSNK